MAWVAYDNFKLCQMGGCALNFATGGTTFKVALTTATYTADQAAHNHFAHVTNEVTGSNYTAGGATVGTQTVAVASHTLTADCADVTWTQHASGFSNARTAVLYAASGGTDTWLIAYYDLTSDRGNVAGDLVLGTPSGIFTF